MYAHKLLLITGILKWRYSGMEISTQAVCLNVPVYLSICWSIYVTVKAGYDQCINVRMLIIHNGKKTDIKIWRTT